MVSFFKIDKPRKPQNKMLRLFSFKEGLVPSCSKQVEPAFLMPPDLCVIFSTDLIPFPFLLFLPLASQMS